MTFSEEQVEWIVVEVIRRLGLITADGAPTSANSGELRLDERVVTMQVVGSRLNGVQRLVVPKKAVVTPAVQDELKAKKVEMVREQ